MSNFKNEYIQLNGENIPYKFTDTLDGEKIRSSIIKGYGRLKKFASSQNWDKHVEESFIDSIEIYDSKPEFDYRVKEILDLDQEIVFPPSFSAGLEGKILISLSPELYFKNYPDGNEKGFFEKLVTHEIAHRLHVRILNGDEDAMGPLWLFEGFSTYVANQFAGAEQKLSETEIWKIVSSTQRGSYLKYNYVFKHFMEKYGLKPLLKAAKRDDLVEWLRSD